MFDVIAFDADDTLWHNETLYAQTEGKFAALLAPYAGEAAVHRKLLETEEANLSRFGYGIKSFTLSMIETAIQLSAGEIAGSAINKIIDYAKEMLGAQVELLEGAEEAVARLADAYRLMLITKGDLLDQRSKLARSRIGRYFEDVEVVSNKDETTYRALLHRHRIAPERLLMVGNSLRSDILPVLAIGGYAVHIPYQITWAHERVPAPALDHERFFTVENLERLPAFIEGLSDGH